MSLIIVIAILIAVSVGITPSLDRRRQSMSNKFGWDFAGLSDTYRPTLTPLPTIGITGLVILAVRESMRVGPPIHYVVAPLQPAIITLIGTSVTVATSRSTIGFVPILGSLALCRKAASIRHRDSNDGERFPRHAGPRWRRRYAMSGALRLAAQGSRSLHRSFDGSRPDNKKMIEGLRCTMF